MKKMRTLFKRQFENYEIAKFLSKVEPECMWFLSGIIIILRKEMISSKRWNFS